MIATIGLFAVIVVVGLITGYRDEGLSIATAGYGVLAILGVLGLVGAARCRIVLDSDTLEVVELWSRKRYARSDIEVVKFEWGSGVFLQVAGGGWTKLPELGRNAQGIANTVRAWRKRANGS
jgi:hypothetical protein